MGKETQEAVRNFLVPIVEKASKEEIEEACKEYNITTSQLPHIKVTDAGLKGLSVGAGDIIKITRKSWVTDGKTAYYRLVVE